MTKLRVNGVPALTIYVCQIQWRALDEINAGVCDGMTYEEIKKNMPDEYEYVANLSSLIYKLNELVFQINSMFGKLHISQKSILASRRSFFPELILVLEPTVERFPNID